MQNENVNSFEMKPFYAAAGSLHNYNATRGQNAAGETMLDVKFESASEAMRWLNENHKESKKKDNGFILYDDTCSDSSDIRSQQKVHEWRYGNHKNYLSCVKYLTDGTAMKSEKELFEKFRKQLLENYPALNELESMAMLSKKRKSYREQGDELDIDRFLNNEIEMWQTKANKQTIKRAARINLAMPTSASNNAENFTKSICFLAAMSDIVESANISTELSISFCLSRANSLDNFSAYTITLKNTSEQLDVERLISSGSSGLFRNFVFNMIANIHGGGEVGWGLGSCINANQYHEKFKNGIDADVHIYAEDVWRSHESGSNPKVEIIIKELTQAVGIDFDMFKSLV